MNKKRKVIFVGKYKTAGNIYSIQNVSFEVFKSHSSKKNSDFICYFDDGKLFSKYQKLFGKKLELKNAKGKIIRLGILRFIFYLIKNPNSIIHIISFEKIGIIAVMLKKILKLKILYTIHGIEEFEGNYFMPIKFTHRLKLKISRHIFERYSDYIITQSHLYKDLITKILKIKPNKIKVIPNGISQKFNKTYIQNKINSQIKLISIANPKRTNKGFDFLINIINKLNFNYELTIVCGKDEAKKVSEDLKINYVNNLPQDKLSRLIENMNIILVTSKIESFSIPAIEAMALGRICIITDTSGASEYILDKKNGYIVKYFDTGKVVKIIKELFNNSELVEVISKEARNIYDILNWETIYNDYYSKLYDKD